MARLCKRLCHGGRVDRHIDRSIRYRRLAGAAARVCSTNHGGFLAGGDAVSAAHWGYIQTIYGLVRLLDSDGATAWLAQGLTTLGAAQSFGSCGDPRPVLR